MSVDLKEGAKVKQLTLLPQCHAGGAVPQRDVDNSSIVRQFLWRDEEYLDMYSHRNELSRRLGEVFACSSEIVAENSKVSSFWTLDLKRRNLVRLYSESKRT